MRTLLTFLPVLMILKTTAATAHIDIDVDNNVLRTGPTEATEAPSNGTTKESLSHYHTPPNTYEFRRIYNPQETVKIDNYPFMAAVLVNREMWCGGVIVKPNMVLTAANCLKLHYNNRFFREYIKMVSVRVGSTNASSGGQIYRASELFFHPNYKPDTLENNLVMIRLAKYINFFKKNIPVAVIPHSSDPIVPIDRNITFLGWGTVATRTAEAGKVLLQKVELPIYDLVDCQAVYGPELVTRTNFCAGYISLLRNVCNHDAGGPAIMDGMLVGILSFSNARCDELDKPAVFTTVGANVAWLESDLRQAKNDSLNLFNI